MKESPGIIARLARTYRLAVTPEELALRGGGRGGPYCGWATHLPTGTVIRLGPVPHSESGRTLLIRAHTHPDARRLRLPLAP